MSKQVSPKPMIHTITVLSKEGCHLCERAIQTLRDLSMTKRFYLEIVDISKDRVQFEKYFIKIPVVRLDGKDVFEVEQIALPNECKKNLGKLVENLN
ncbi:MAG: glutaredoxin family protein [Nitrososphaerota archaeon]|nr:glutaredoxin family protein [Nitrososphaerota archaeon]